MNGLTLESSVCYENFIDPFDTKFACLFEANLVDICRNFCYFQDFLKLYKVTRLTAIFCLSQISTNVPYLTSVTAVLRVKIPKDHTSAVVTAGTLEMDAHAEVPSDLDLLAQFFRDCN